MAHYRFYRLLGNRIVQGEDIELPDDAAAEREAEERLGAGGASTCEAIEIWQGKRRVAHTRPS